jgi:SNF2 family DNA or RNA helicase
VLLAKFRSDASYTLLLISLKAGGVGLNLVAASCVFFLDCWWNPAVEQQAIDRVHRIGQTRTVRVKRFVVEDSVEERILEMQQQKLLLAQSVHNTDGVGGVGEGVDVNLLLQCLR